MQTQPYAGRRGFTLVELLAVVAIILLLLGMILPGIAAVRNAARKAKARGDIATIENAVKAYLNDVGKLPIPDAEQGQQEYRYFAQGADSQWVMQRLTTTNNPRGIVYTEPQNNAQDGTYKDPWGTQYALKFDADYNGILEYYSGGGNPGSECIPAPVIVISYGPNRKQDDPKTGDDIVSEAWKMRSAAGK